MYRKILDGLAAASFVLILGTLGSGFFGYKYITSEQGKAQIKNAIMSDLPGAIGAQLPKATGPALPFK